MDAKRRGFLKWVPFLAAVAVVPVETTKAEPKKDPDAPVPIPQLMCSSYGSMLDQVLDWKDWKQGDPLPDKVVHCTFSRCRLYGRVFRT